jgi:hypothetical protein
MTYPEAIEKLLELDKRNIGDQQYADDPYFLKIADCMKSMANELAAEGGARPPYPGVNVEWL